MSTRNSVQREWIYDYIQRQDAHLSADEIYEGLLKEGKNISLATVYRNLSILVDEYKIASVMTDSKSRSMIKHVNLMIILFVLSVIECMI